MNMKQTTRASSHRTPTHRALLARVTEADLRLLRVFMAIVDANGLAAAELALNISRSVISRHLKDLESRLGVRLCERGRAGFALTAEGRAVDAAARQLIAQIDTFRSQIAELHDDLRGDLHLAVFDKFVTNPACKIAEAIAAFARAAPAVRLHVHVQSGAGIEQGLLDGRFQVAVHPFHRASDAVRSVPLFTEHMRLYCAASHPLARIAPSDDALRRALFVGLAYHSQNMETYWRLGLAPQATATDQEGTLALLASGGYLGFLPTHYAERFVSAGTLVALPNDAFRYDCEWHGAVRRMPAPSRLAGAFLEQLIAAHAHDNAGAVSPRL